MLLLNEKKSYTIQILHFFFFYILYTYFQIFMFYMLFYIFVVEKYHVSYNIAKVTFICDK